MASQNGNTPGTPAAVAGVPRPSPKPRPVICPYCGHRPAAPERCDRCRGLFDPLSRQASQNAMGPWYIRDEANPFRPGCSFATLRALVARGRVTPETILRGPTTRQFWARAADVPGVGNLLGHCHACRAEAAAHEAACRHCGASFEVPADRQRLGLGPAHPLPGQSSPEEIAAVLTGTGSPAVVTGARPAGRPEPVAAPMIPDDAITARLRAREQRQSGRRLVAAMVVMIVAVLAAGAWLIVQVLDRAGPAGPAASGQSARPSEGESGGGGGAARESPSPSAGDEAVAIPLPADAEPAAEEPAPVVEPSAPATDVAPAAPETEPGARDAGADWENLAGMFADGSLPALNRAVGLASDVSGTAGARARAAGEALRSLRLFTSGL